MRGHPGSRLDLSSACSFSILPPQGSGSRLPCQSGVSDLGVTLWSGCHHRFLCFTPRWRLSSCPISGCSEHEERLHVCAWQVFYLPSTMNCREQDFQRPSWVHGRLDPGLKMQRWLPDSDSDLLESFEAPPSSRSGPALLPSTSFPQP